MRALILGILGNIRVIDRDAGHERAVLAPRRMLLCWTELAPVRADLVTFLFTALLLPVDALFLGNGRRSFLGLAMPAIATRGARILPIHALAWRSNVPAELARPV